MLFWGRKKNAHLEVGGSAPAATTESPDVVPQECQKCQGFSVLLDEKLSRYIGDINGRIEHASKVSNKEIMSIGDCVNNIVTHTRQHIEESKVILEKNFTEQTESLKKYLGGAQETTNTQNHTIAQAMTLSDDISKAGTAVERLASETRLLALNATIEAARLGESGKAFGVISGRMNVLSTEISEANQLIGEAVGAIRECLPTIMKQASAQIENLTVFVSNTQNLKDTIEQSMATTSSAGDTHLDKILSLAYLALSHLQFQDPMIQDLQKIDAILQNLHEELKKEQDHSGDSTAVPDSAGPAGADSNQDLLNQDNETDPGEVMLF